MMQIMTLKVTTQGEFRVDISMDQFQYLSSSALIPPLIQQWSTVNVGLREG